MAEKSEVNDVAEMLGAAVVAVAPAVVLVVVFDLLLQPTNPTSVAAAVAMRAARFSETSMNCSSLGCPIVAAPDLEMERECPAPVPVVTRL
jgi:hypothetical protein